MPKIGGLGLLLHKQFAAEVLHHTALAVVFHEGIVLFGRPLGKRLKPVCVMGDTHLHRPPLHTGSHGIGYRTVEACAVVYHINKFGVDIRRQLLVHFLACEDVFGKILRRSAGRSLYIDSLFLEGLFYYLKS